MNRSFRLLAAGLLAILMSTQGHAQIEPDECTNPAVAPTTPSTAFQPLGDGGEVLHRKTGLVWKRCGFGQTWDGQTCQGNPAGRNWNLALGVAANAGDSWRLPSVKELLTIVERCRHDPAINREVFPRPARHSTGRHRHTCSWTVVSWLSISSTAEIPGAPRG